MKILNNICIIDGFLWLLFMFMFPSIFQQIKYITLIILIIISFIYIIITKKAISKSLILGILLWLSYSLFSLLWGINNGYKVDFDLVNIYFITPIVALILSIIVDNKQKLIYLNKMLVIITFMIVVLDFIYILNRVGVLNIPGIDFNSPIFGSAVLENNKIEYRITNQSSLIFLLPYNIAIFISQEYKNKREKYLLFSTIFLGIIVTLLSGRRTFQFVVALAFILAIIFIKLKIFKFNISMRNPCILKKITFFVFLLILSIFAYKSLSDFTGIDNLFLSIKKTFLSAFDMSSKSGVIRTTQASLLIDGFKSSPIIGHGINSYLIDYIRSTRTPWSYEWVYIAFLYQSGIIGIAIFFSLIYCILKKLYYKVKGNRETRAYFFGIFIGFICFIISGSSNPMVYYIWAWSLALIPYSFIDCDIDKI
ncbi:O-antigen ligase domain-containing protein [Clostridium perfringens]|uniref:O-antigen ligase family protein n=1 Tax=Clostridium perfringens TaxID=1502 RepID=UPI000F8DA479|nr:O-antigen ligase family protein [Clostridium perfringens]RUR38706.1 O-antigen ligase domain-containing protein [Clostridium perfringens]